MLLNNKTSNIFLLNVVFAYCQLTVGILYLICRVIMSKLLEDLWRKMFLKILQQSGIMVSHNYETNGANFCFLAMFLGRVTLLDCRFQNALQFSKLKFHPEPKLPQRIVVRLKWELGWREHLDIVCVCVCACARARTHACVPPCQVSDTIIE